jgi:hypothetical protein
MDPGVRTPFVDFFRRGEVARDVRLEAARGALAPRALEQLALLLILADDGDREVAAAARTTLDAIPPAPLSAFLARSEVPAEMRAWFAARGVVPASAAGESDEPLTEDRDGHPGETGEAVLSAEATTEGPAPAGVARLASLSVMQKMKVAMRGTREERSVLVRDANRLVAAAVLSSPKLTENEVEGIARMANVGEEVLRVIGTTRTWLKNYAVVAGLARNPKTPVGVALHLLNRLTERDIKMLMSDRNVPDPVRVAARKRVTESQSRK